MFRTELDLELKEQDESGSPFFNLRDSIYIILSKHLEETEVCLELKYSLRLASKVVLY